VATPDLEQSASAKTGLIRRRRSNSNSGPGGQETSRQWDADCVIDPQGGDRRNFDFTTESP